MSVSFLVNHNQIFEPGSTVKHQRQTGNEHLLAFTEDLEATNLWDRRGIFRLIFFYMFRLKYAIKIVKNTGKCW